MIRSWRAGGRRTRPRQPRGQWRRRVDRRRAPGVGLRLRLQARALVQRRCEEQRVAQRPQGCEMARVARRAQRAVAQGCEMLVAKKALLGSRESQYVLAAALEGMRVNWAPPLGV